MKRNKFTLDQIAKILEEFELSKDEKILRASKVSAKLRFISGTNVMVVWKPAS